MVKIKYYMNKDEIHIYSNGKLCMIVFIKKVKHETFSTIYEGELLFNSEVDVEVIL